MNTTIQAHTATDFYPSRRRTTKTRCVPAVLNAYARARKRAKRKGVAMPYFIEFLGGAL